MYRRITAGYQIWKIVSDLRMVFFIRENVLTVRNILVASATDGVSVGTPQKIKLLEFSVKGLRILGVINICIGSICNPYGIPNVLTAPVHILDSFVPIKARKMYMDIYGGCSEAVRTLPKVYRHFRKSQGYIGMVLGEGHGCESSRRIFLEVYTDNRDRLYG